MADFVESGGDAGDIPGMLRRGFVGYPQMASVLRQWLKIAGVDDGDDAAWKALKKEVFKRLDPSALDDATLRRLKARPAFLDQLLANRRGRDFVVELFCGLSARSENGRSDLLGLCLREIATRGHASELLEAPRLDLSEDLHLFEATIIDAVIRTKGAMQDAFSPTQDDHGRVAASLAHDLARMCGSRVPARCYVLRVLEALETSDVKDGLLWRRTRQKIRLTVNLPRKLLLDAPGRRSNSQLRDAACAFATAPSLLSLAGLAAAYDQSPNPAILRVSLVANRLFDVAFNPQLASEATVLTASPLIALAATAPTENGDDPLLSTFNKAAFNDATSNLAASVHAAVLTSARICLDDRFVTRPNEPESRNGPVSRADRLRIASLLWPAARHGVLVFLRASLESPVWLSSKLRSFIPTLMGILRAYAACPASQRDVFDIYKLVINAPQKAIRATGDDDGTAHISTRPHDNNELNDARKSAVLALVDLASAWHDAPEILYHAEVNNAINARQLRHFAVRLARKALPPYSPSFARAAASLLTCHKAKEAWCNIETFPKAEQTAIRSLAARVTDALKNDTFVDARYLTRLSHNSGQIALPQPPCLADPAAQVQLLEASNGNATITHGSLKRPFPAPGAPPQAKRLRDVTTPSPYA